VRLHKERRLMIGSEFLLAILTGVVLAVPYVIYARRMRDRRRVFGIGLVTAAAVYVGFALRGGTRKEILIELTGIVVFGLFVVLGVRYSIDLLALGWASHVVWDLLIHPVSTASYAPWWYPVMCIGFDLFVAGAIVGASWPPRRDSA
jgi:hypothetical protein